MRNKNPIVKERTTDEASAQTQTNHLNNLCSQFLSSSDHKNHPTKFTIEHLNKKIKIKKIYGEKIRLWFGFGFGSGWLKLETN